MTTTLASQGRGRPKGKAAAPDTSSPLLVGFLTVPQVAAACGRSTHTVMQWTKAGLPHRRLGPTVLISIDEFRAWMEKRGDLAEPRKRARNK